MGVDAEKLRSLIEDALQKRMGIKPPEPQPASEKPPIEPVKPVKEHQFKPPEAEVKTRNGQVLIVRPEEELRPLARRFEELPDVQTRLRALLKRRGKGREETDLERLREESVQSDVGRSTDKSRDGLETALDRTVPNRTTDELPNRTADTVPDRTADVTPDKTTEREVLVLDRNALRMFVSALPAHVFSMPAASVLAFISRAAGAPIVLAPHLPRPMPRESFGAWLDKVFAGTGFRWRSIASQREAFVFA
jgi:hypothetical protein